MAVAAEGDEPRERNEEEEGVAEGKDTMFIGRGGAGGGGAGCALCTACRLPLEPHWDQPLNP